MSVYISRFLKTILATLVLAFSWGSLAEAITIQFKERVTKWEAIDLGKTGASLVDLDAGNGIILDLKGKQIGTMDFQSVLTNIKAKSENRWLNVQYTFSNGLDSIIIQGNAVQQSDTKLATKNIPYYYAVTGGTGTYAGANGVCKVVRVTDAEWINTCKFEVLNIKF